MKLERLVIDGEEYFLEIKDKSNTRNHSWYWECEGRSGSMPWLSQCYCWDRATKEAIVQFRLLLDMHKKEINRKEQFGQLEERDRRQFYVHVNANAKTWFTDLDSAVSYSEKVGEDIYWIDSRGDDHQIITRKRGYL